ncbi:MAG: hypothetical protein ACFBSE_11665, partial [Prochloraceae cyanobacterium]
LCLIFSLISFLIQPKIYSNTITSESIDSKVSFDEQTNPTFEQQNKKNNPAQEQTVLLAETKNGKPFIEIRYKIDRNLNIDTEQVEHKFYNHIGVSRSSCNAGIIVPLYSNDEPSAVIGNEKISFKYLIHKAPQLDLYHGLLYEHDLKPFSLNQIRLPQNLDQAVLIVNLDPSVLEPGQYQMNLAAFCSASAAPEWNIESKLIVQ